MMHQEFTPDYSSQEADLSEYLIQQPEPELIVVSVPTATVILHDPADPYMVLVGLSEKHEKPVLPGGKIDLADMVTGSMEQTAEYCIRREIFEECRVRANNLTLLEVRCDFESDVRTISVAKLKGTLKEEEVAHLNADDQIEAHYGCPDYIFLGEMDPQIVSATAELYQVGFADIRHIPEGSLSAGHWDIVQSYKDRLNSSMC